MKGKFLIIGLMMLMVTVCFGDIQAGQSKYYHWNTTR